MKYTFYTALIAAALTVVACGEKKSQNAPAPTPAPATAPAPEAKSAPAPEAAPAMEEKKEEEAK